MIWIIYALLSAVFSTISTIARKKTLVKEHSISFLSINKLFQLIIVLILIPFINFDMALSTYAIVAVIAVLSVESDIFWTKSLKRLNISIAAPLTNFSPVIVAVLAFFMLEEKITYLQIIGMALIVIGAYVLEADHGKDIKNVWLHIKKSKYSLMLFLSLLIGAFSSIGDRYIVGNNIVNPISMIFWFYVFTTVLVLTIQLNDRDGFSKIKNTLKRTKFPIIVTAVSGLLTTAFYYLAIKSVYISLVMPILLTSTLFTTVIGGEFFKEKNLFYKSVACLVMVVGVFLIIGTSI
ncbi:DMT family transporter [Candidatus Woesearchaeota archaeon]|nr:DMT family transporter [Candidatus Woesearchaeota archaeon]